MYKIQVFHIFINIRTSENMIAIKSNTPEVIYEKIMFCIWFVSTNIFIKLFSPIVNKIDTAVNIKPNNIPQTSKTVFTKSNPSCGLILIYFPKKILITIPANIPAKIGNIKIIFRSLSFVFVLILCFMLSPPLWLYFFLIESFYFFICILRIYRSFLSTYNIRFCN